MAIETELKLRVTPEHLARLKRHALFKTHQITAPRTLRLHNIYFDTPTLELHQSRMALRLRRVGGRWLQTLKGGGQVMAGLHQRLEWEVPVPSAKLDFSGLDEVVWDAHLPLALRANLQPVFVTDFYRSSRQLTWQGAIIEVCMDHGCVKTLEHSTPICEVELELKSGDPLQLFDLAQTILEIVPFELEGVSKAEQGFRLLASYIAHPVKGVVPNIAKSERLADGLQTLIWSCLQHLQSNLRGAMEGRDAEYLHQMRVALRRLRVVLRMAEKILADVQLTALRKALGELAVALGRIREWDVFIADICAMPSGHAGLQELLASCRLQRAGCYATLFGAVQARELQGLLLRFAIWMNSTYWQQAVQAAPEMRYFATHRLHQLARRYEKAGRDLHTLDAQQLHVLRIHAKKLRYSAEFFATLYDTRKVKSYLAALGEVQELLGEINDIAVAHRLLDEQVTKLPECREIIVFIKGAIDADLSKKFKELHKGSKCSYKQKAFWE